MSIKGLHSTSYFGVCRNVIVNHHIYCWNIQSPTSYVSTKENIALPGFELIQGSESLWLSKDIIIKIRDASLPSHNKEQKKKKITTKCNHNTRSVVQLPDSYDR